MNRFIQFWQRSKQNKVFVVVVVAIALLAFEITTQIFSDLPFFRSSAGVADVVATVVTVESDVRQRPVEETNWYRAEPKAEIIRGDAVYSGKQSRSQVQMKSGGWIELGEETLVIFDDVDGVTIPDVTRGQVKLKVSGQMRIAISGEVTEFTGAESELVLNLEGLRRQIQVLRGETSIAQSGGASRSLTKGQTFELPPSAVVVSGPPKIQVPRADELVTEASLRNVRKPVSAAPVEIKPIEFAEPVVTIPEPVIEAPIAPEFVPEPVVSEAKVEAVAETPVVVTEAVAPTDPALNINRVMKVQEVYKRSGKTALVPRVGLKTLKVPVALQWSGAKDDDKLHLQVSKTKDFKSSWEERAVTGTNVVLQEWRPGKNYWRVSRDKENWSEPAEVIVKPTVSPSQRPTVTPLKRQLIVAPKGRGPEVQAKLRFEDQGLSKPRGWVLQGSSAPDFSPKKTKTVYVKDPRVDVPINRPGRYFFRVRSVAEAGEISRFSDSIEVTAVPAAAPSVPLRTRLAEKEAVRERKIANIEAEKQRELEEKANQEALQESARTRSKLSTRTRKEEDLRPRPWAVTLEGGATALVSTEQIDLGSQPAATHVIGLKVGYNNQRDAASLGYKAKFGSSNSEGSAQSNSKLSARYTRWWQTGWSPLKLGWLGGLDSYRNSSSTEFSKGYDFAKTGVDVGIRMADRWRTGGDIAIGTWTDTNKLYEIGGFITYELSTELAFGVGYRLSLFEAGSEASVPIALPYREAMGEAYSSLQFSF